VQADGLLQDTPRRRLIWVGELFGLGTIDHADPFQDSIRVCEKSPLR
jgi:hypothetical protein